MLTQTMPNPAIKWRSPASWPTRWITLFREFLEDRRMIAGLKRAAALSPHLLSDMGFVRTHIDARSAVQIWTKNDITISIRSSPDMPTPIITVSLHQRS